MALVRRSCAFIITLAFVLGMLVHSSMLHASSTAAGPCAVSADRAAGHCGNCANQAKDMSLGTCAVACSTASVIMASEPGLHVSVPARYAPGAEALRTAQSGPPDPYPPRPLILS